MANACIMFEFEISQHCLFFVTKRNCKVTANHMLHKDIQSYYNLL